MTWADFRERYDREVLASLAENTAGKVWGLFKTVEAKLNPARLVDLTEQRLSHLQAALRSDGLAESTIKGHLAYLKAALRWAVTMGMLAKAPTIAMPKRAKGSKGGDPLKGRPITGEEFERMLGKVESGLTLAAERAAEMRRKREMPKRQARAEVLEEMRTRWRTETTAAVPDWTYLLRGLWLSGLRIGEAVELYWNRDDRLCIDLTGDHPMMRIPAEMEKGHKDRHLPITPDFAEFLLATPEAERTGRVFKLATRRAVPGADVGRDRASHVISAIGQAAGVKVSTDQAGKVKFASAHDLRRSFGERWAAKVMPNVLQQLMRHESIDTTLRFYVKRNAEATAKLLWATVNPNGNGNSFGNSAQNPPVGQAAIRVASSSR